MARKIDIGGYFDRLTKGGRGGRRLDAESDRGSDRGTGSGSGSSSTPDASPTTSTSSSGGLKDVLRDVLAKGRTTTKRTTDEVRSKVDVRRSGARPERELPPEGVVHVEYSPQQDGDPDPGEVVWTWVPFEEDPSQGKDRPVVIIGRRGSKLVGVPLTTKPDDREAQVNMGTGGWDPKRRTSYARVWRMLDVEPDRTRREGAALDRARFEQLIAAVDHYYDITVPATATTTTTATTTATTTTRSGDDFDD